MSSTTVMNVFEDPALASCRARDTAEPPKKD
jgi:hypothetical protein